MNRCGLPLPPGVRCVPPHAGMRMRGMNRTTGTRRRFSRGVPRACGDEPEHGKLADCDGERSPRMRDEVSSRNAPINRGNHLRLFRSLAPNFANIAAAEPAPGAAVATAADMLAQHRPTLTRDAARRSPRSAPQPSSAAAARCVRSSPHGLLVTLGNVVFLGPLVSRYGGFLGPLVSRYAVALSAPDGRPRLSPSLKPVCATLGTHPVEPCVAVSSDRFVVRSRGGRLSGLPLAIAPIGVHALLRRPAPVLTKRK
jgi:hypothetical protein